MSRTNNSGEVSTFRQGPVQQNRALQAVICALEALLSETPPSLSTNLLKQLEISLPDGRLINLSCALRNANFDYFFLSDAFCAKIQEKLKVTPSIEEMDKSRPTLYPLHALEKAALTTYTGKSYEFFNNLLRGIESNPASTTSHLENLFYSLLCISAANKNILTTLELDLESFGFRDLFCISDMEDKILKRVIHDVPIGVFSQLSRKNHPQLLRGMLSFTEADKALWGFGHTILEIRGLNFSNSIAMYSQCEHEKEVLLPPCVFYTREITTEDGKTVLNLELVRGPDIKDSYLTELALSEAACHHLLNRYKDGTSRENHGLAHHVRVVHYSDEVIDYFLRYAADENFRLFCARLSPEDIDIIKVLLAFSKTGRESEISYFDNPEKYQEFQDASCENVRRFFNMHLSLTDHQIEFYIEILRYMGNPDFAKKATGSSEEQQSKIFLNHIITLAHKLDLSRCYSSEEYNKALNHYASSTEGIIQDSPEQVKAFDRLKEIALASIKFMSSKSPHCECDNDVFYAIDQFIYARNWVDTPSFQRINVKEHFRTLGLQQDIILNQKYELWHSIPLDMQNKILPVVFPKVVSSGKLGLLIKSLSDFTEILQKSFLDSLASADREHAVTAICHLIKDKGVIRSQDSLEYILHHLRGILTHEEYNRIPPELIHYHIKILLLEGNPINLNTLKDFLSYGSFALTNLSADEIAEVKRLTTEEAAPSALKLPTELLCKIQAIVAEGDAHKNTFFITKEVEQLREFLDEKGRDDLSAKLLMRLKVLSVSDQSGDTVIHDVAKVPGLLEAMLELLPENDKLAAITLPNQYNSTVLHRITENTPLLKKILALFPANDERLVAALVAALTQRDLYGHTVLHHAIKTPASLNIVLTLLPENMRLKVLSVSDQSGDTVIHSAAKVPGLLETVLELLPENDKLAAITLPNEHNSTVLHRITENTSLLKKILALFPANDERLVAALTQRYADGCTVLHHAIKTPASLNIALALLPENMRLKVLSVSDQSGDTVIFSAARFPELLEAVLKLLPKNDKLVAITATGRYKKTVLHEITADPFVLKKIVNLFPKNDGRLITALTQRDTDGRTVLHYAAATPESFKIALNYLPENKRLEVLTIKNIYGNTPCYHASRSLESLKVMLELLPENDRFAALTARNEDMGNQTLLEKFCPCPESVKALLELLPQDKRLAAIIEKDKRGRTFLHRAVESPRLLETVLKLLPENDRLTALTVEDRFNRPLILFVMLNPECFEAVLKLLSEDAKALLIFVENNRVGSLVHMSAWSAKSLKIVLELLPEEKRFDHLTAKRKDGYTPLHLIVDSDFDNDNAEECLKIALTLLPRDKRLAALMVMNSENNTVLNEASKTPGRLESALELLEATDRIALEHMELIKTIPELFERIKQFNRTTSASTSSSGPGLFSARQPEADSPASTTDAEDRPRSR